MRPFIKELWHSIQDIGNKDFYDIEQQANIQNANTICIINTFLTLQGGFLIYILFPKQPFFWFIYFIASLNLLSLVFNYFSYHRIAKLMPWIIAQIGVFVCSVLFGQESDVHTLYVIIMLGAIMAHSHESAYTWSFLISVPILLSLILYFVDFRLFSIEHPPLPLQLTIAKDIYIINILSGIVATIFFVKKHERNRKIIQASKNELLSKYEELAATHAELDKFVYSVSHDLRAPIASTLGLIDISLQESDLEQVRKYLYMGQKSLLKLEKFIRDVLSYSHNSRMEIKAESINLNLFIQEIWDILIPDPQSNRIKIALEIAQEIPFYCDKQRLYFILSNLMSNAIKYHNPKEDQPFIAIEAKVTATSLHLVVRDNGIGIAQAHQANIFDMFYRAHSTSAQSSGLGLYIVKEAIKKLNGTIFLHSQPNIGTSFTMEIPNQSVATT